MTIRLYDAPLSGNCYKVRLLCAQLGLDYERVEIDVVDRARPRTALVGRNPAGRVPVIEFDDGRCLAESNAILVHLAEGTALVPDGRFERAVVLQWLFFEQNQHEPNVAVARYLQSILGAPDHLREMLERRRAAGAAAIGVLERHLVEREWIVGPGYGIADIALFAYTHVAGEGGIDLESFPAVRGWLDRVRRTPGWVPMLDPDGGD